MGSEHERASKKHRSPARVRGTQADRSVDSDHRSRDGTIVNYGLKPETLYVCELGFSRIIPTAD
jgi:hypothetical protein